MQAHRQTDTQADRYAMDKMQMGHAILQGSLPMQSIFAVPSSPKVLEVAKHDMGCPTAGPIPLLVG